MARTVQSDTLTSSLLAQFIVLGRLDAAILSFSFAAIILADFQPQNSAGANGLIVFAFAAVAAGTVINGIRRAISIRRHRMALTRAENGIAEFDRIDTEDDNDTTQH